MDSPHHLERLRLQMQNVVHSIQSSFVACACGKNAKDCAVRWMEQFVDGGAEGVQREASAEPPAKDLGPLIGTKRGVRTRVRGGLATGGMKGVELVGEDGEAIPSDEQSKAAGKQRLVGPGMSGRRVPPRLAARKSFEELDAEDIADDMAPPPKMRKGRGSTASQVNGRVDGGVGDGIAGMRVDMDVGVVVGGLEETTHEPRMTGALSSRLSKEFRLTIFLVFRLSGRRVGYLVYFVVQAFTCTSCCSASSSSSPSSCNAHETKNILFDIQPPQRGSSLAHFLVASPASCVHSRLRTSPISTSTRTSNFIYDSTVSLTATCREFYASTRSAHPYCISTGSFTITPLGSRYASASASMLQVTLAVPGDDGGGATYRW